MTFCMAHGLACTWLPSESKLHQDASCIMASRTAIHTLSPAHSTPAAPLSHPVGKVQSHAVDAHMQSVILLPEPSPPCHPPPQARCRASQWTVAAPLRTWRCRTSRRGCAWCWPSCWLSSCPGCAAGQASCWCWAAPTWTSCCGGEWRDGVWCGCALWVCAAACRSDARQGWAGAVQAVCCCQYAAACCCWLRPHLLVEVMVMMSCSKRTLCRYSAAHHPTPRAGPLTVLQPCAAH